MKIAFLTPEYPHPKVSSSAGIGTSVKNLVEALVEKGIQVTIFVYHQNTSAVFEENGVVFHIVPKKKFKIGTWYFYRKFLQNYINATVSKENIDILEAPDWTGITVFMKFKIPLVIRFHGTDAYFCKLENRKQKFKNFVFEKVALKKAVAFISPTNFTKQQTATLFSLNESKISVIPNGVDLDYFNNGNPHSFEEKTLLYIGTLIRKKGVLELAKIFNAVIEEEPDAKLVLIGSDSFDIKTGSNSTYKLMLEAFSDAAKANTRYLRKIPYSQIKNHIKNAHVCAFPSFAETFGMVTVESMALQKPVVNTNIGWANEIIDDGINGYLIHPTETKVYAEQIVHLFKDKSLCLNIGKSAKQKVESTFDIKNIAIENINFYKAVISESKA
ncbi:glycosyltransferase family 1 protein [Hyunsoonleella flava]|uniref:Glycosyltransferase family 1 protein n=1 Tax=Hyunsoonleella flava TaxID=2527939 RepID=A0A4Q9FDR6_9FLAO|nr:glycosyltransferase family 4 protein [Hyunsoonleella flava]TBN03608.1 glycosyltransferase family 1 protein [Hyunsoonleella flava]